MTVHQPAHTHREAFHKLVYKDDASTAHVKLDVHVTVVDIIKLLADCALVVLHHLKLEHLLTIHAHNLTGRRSQWQGSMNDYYERIQLYDDSIGKKRGERQHLTMTKHMVTKKKALCDNHRLNFNK